MHSIKSTIEDAIFYRAYEIVGVSAERYDAYRNSSPVWYYQFRCRCTEMDIPEFIVTIYNPDIDARQPTIGVKLKYGHYRTYPLGVPFKSFSDAGEYYERNHV